MQFDVVIVGGGAAGLFCARTAGQRGRRVLLLEHNARLGNKILISGGGRCNFTNLGATAAHYLTQGSPHFAKSALARCTALDFLALVEHHGIAWHEKKLGQLFCDHSSKQILQMLEDECADARVKVRPNCRVSSIRRTGWSEDPDAVAERVADQPTQSLEPPEWFLETSQGSVVTRSLVIATGGLSFPKLGATPFGYEVARQFGVRLVPPRPGLVPLTLGEDDLTTFGELSGLSLDCEVSAGLEAPRFREHFLFTHRGLSGPAILQISSYCAAGEAIRLDLLPDQSALDLLTKEKAGGRDAKSALRSVWPDRFAAAWCARFASSKPIAQMSQRELEALARRVHSWEIVPSGDEGYPKAEVTVGGVATSELSSKTLECRRVRGLFFVGEVVDITGWLGGYNFQWAWASGHAAGQAV
ncbi:MAG TPA: NAD(P)/FAD-dependent oxidoreductase [Verrucomicrobiota bacterium]|nr:aminoacetone oxidase family FAD-binding enzyme [Verrucomicrobiales bacterium]HRI13181.1 NAD(P)/FAD-dependent oxidoreductase [Verrucomicrobiota bacterium]